MSKTHEAISKAKTQTWHRIHALSATVFSRDRAFRRQQPVRLVPALIERFPTPGSITSIGRAALTEQAWPLIGRKVSKARVVNDIYETACASTALPIDEDPTAVTMFRMVISQARTLIQQRNEIERIAHDALATNSDYQLLRMIPGIGPDQRPDDPGRAVAIYAGSATIASSSSSAASTSLPTSQGYFGADEAIKVRQCPAATHLLDGNAGRDPTTQQQLP